MRGAPDSARGVAAEVLRRVFEQDAYAAPALSSELSRARLPSLDRGLATELCYGVLRTEKYLRRRIEGHANLGRASRPAEIHLLLGVYQLDFLDRVPAHAVLSEAVRLVKEAGDLRGSGFVNAVLRKVVAQGREGAQSRREATLANVPSFLRKRLVRDVGEEDAWSLLSPEAPPAPTLRVRPGRPLPFTAQQLEAIPSCPGAYRFLGKGDPRRDPGHARGDYLVQELGAQIIAQLLAVLPGERVLDVCAGRGHKAILLGDAGAHVWATDLHAHKVRALEEELTRLGVPVSARVHDWTTPAPEDLRGLFDAVLVDAPCSGVGTLRRRPEILRRLEPDTPGRLAALQERILRNAAACLKPTGRLIFATCSVLAEEAETVTRACSDVLVPRSSFSGRDRLTSRTSPTRLLPRTDDSDGYFVACLGPRDGGGS